MAGLCAISLLWISINQWSAPSLNKSQVELSILGRLRGKNYIWEISMRKYIYIAVLFLGFGLGSAWAQSPHGTGSSASNSALCPLYIPNAFTPNGDNINDRFELRISENCELVKFSLQVFDRWGRMVYQSNSIDAEKAWDGRFENEDLQQGVYLFKLSAEMVNYNNSKADPVKYNKQGSVVLIR